ncbi:uncharacterized protein LOC143427208 [Xylocopa sonorina]|uniref:uncharacterized protein LOC143427208 n=1 Tax=Xylocopa sonorina TaxID=1818115 RepID=UPI00403ACDD3
MDLYGKDKGNISLPAKLQSYEDDDQKAKPTIINLQRTFYDIKIADIKNKINRLEERNNELLEEIETTNELSATVDSESAEEIGNLNKQVLAQSNSVESLKSKIDTVEKNRIEDKQSHEEKIKLFNEKYKKKKVELVSQLKILNARINVLEEFKKAQNALEEKLKSNEIQMVENEKKVKETVEIIDQKIAFNKEILKNEMYDCLLHLAAQFQVEINKHINLPNQRLMRENIMLKNELLQISQYISSKTNARDTLKRSVTEYIKKINLRSSLVKENIVVAKVQHEVLIYLRKKFRNLKEQLSFINVFDPASEKRYLMLIEEARRDMNDVNYHLSSLKTLLDKERTKVSVAKYMLKRLECKLRAITETVYDLKYNVTCLLMCPSARKDLIMLSCIELFLFLRGILVKGESKFRSHIIPSSESIPQELELVPIKEIPEGIDFKITADFVKKEPIIRDIIHEEREVKDWEKEMSIESSTFEEVIEKILEPTAPVDLHVEDSYELFKETEYVGESLFDIDEE